MIILISRLSYPISSRSRLTISVIRNKDSILKSCHGLSSSKFVLSAVEVAIARVEPAKLISKAVHRKQGRLIVSGIRHEKMTFDLTKYDKIYIVGAGKASVPMTVGLVEALQLGRAKSLKVSGSIVTPYGTSKKIPDIDVIEAGHPLPDANGIKGTKKIVNILRRAKPSDLIFVLLS
jgi:glycerate 2-kinase